MKNDQDSASRSLVAGESLPGVSVVIPAYNYARYLPSAIDSALAQTHPQVEVIVVDDGSTDDTRAVAARYGDRIRYIYQANAGLPAARNTGIRAARFPFVAFLDADDEWLPDMLAHGVTAFANLPPEFGLVACRSSYIDADGAPFPPNSARMQATGEMAAGDILLMTRFSPSAVIVRRNVFDTCGDFDTTLTSSEDRDMWIRIASRYRVHLSQDCLSRIRKHTSNMSGNADRMKRNMARVIRKAWQGHWVPRTQIACWLRVLAIFHYQTALMYSGLKRRLPALRDILLSLACWPIPFSGRSINCGISFIRLRTLARILFR